MNLKRFYIILIAALFSGNVSSQILSPVKENLFFETNFGYGTLLPHHNSISYFVEDRINTIDIKLSKATHGNKYWNQLYRYPYYGLGFYRSNLSNDEIYGYVNALYTYLKVPFIGKSNGLNLSYQMAFGMSYLTKHFDIKDNYENLAIGSNLNIYLDLSLQSSIPVSKKIALTNSLRFTHFSNGRIQSPNKGLNLLTASAGLIYQLNSSLTERTITPPLEIKNKNEYTVVYAGGQKTLSRFDGKNYYASSIIFDYYRNYSLKGRWSAGCDFFYDESNKVLTGNTEKSELLNPDLYQFGLHLGHDLTFDKLSIVVNLGGYIYAPVEVLAPIYKRIGLRYRFKNKLVANLTLKTHWAKASFVEWGVGYVF